MIHEEEIYSYCKECVNEPLGNISIPHQIACCYFSDCVLHHKRPIMVTDISQDMMEYLDVPIERLCERTRPLAEPAPVVEDQIEELQAEVRKINIKLMLAKCEP